MIEAVATLDELDEERAVRLAPPPAPRSYGAIARTMKLPDGDQAGKPWDPEVEPVQVCFIRALDGGRFRKFTLITPSQRGKSLTGIALPLVRTLTELMANVAYIMPNLEKLAQQWEGKVRPLIVGTGYGAWLPDKGPGSRGGKPSALTLRHPVTGARAGTLYFMAAAGGGKETSLASISARLAAKDEGDDFASRAHLTLADKRIIGYGDLGHSIEVGTVNHVKGRVGHPMLERYAEGTRCRLWFQCPHCADTGETAGFQVLTFENLIYSGATKSAAKDSARYRCALCAVVWTEADRQKAMLNWREVHEGQTVTAGGKVMGHERPGDHYSILANDLEWSRSTLGDLAEDHFVAAEALRDRGDHELMRLFYLKRRCEDYTADIEEMELGKELTWNDLLTRAQNCAWGPSMHTTDKAQQEGYFYSRHQAPAPAGAEWAIAGIDLQDNRVYIVVTAGNREGTTWDMAWSYHYARLDHKPWDTGDLHRLLDASDLWLHQVNGVLPLVSIGIDVGYGTDRVMAWLRGRPQSPWKACKGTDETMKPQPGDIEGILWRREQLYHINVPATRALTQAAYRRPNGAVGAAHIPNGLNNTSSDRAYLQHLVAEMQVVDPKTRKIKLRQGPGRWDWLDSRRIVYALNRLHITRLLAPKRTVRIGNVGTVLGG